MKITFLTSILKSVKTLVMLSCLSLVFSSQLSAQRLHHPHPNPWWNDSTRHHFMDSIPDWRDSLHIDTTHHHGFGHGGWVDSLHHWLDSVHVAWWDSIHMHLDSGHVHIDSGHTGQDSGHMGQDSGHMGQDSGHMGQDSGHMGQDSGHMGHDSGTGNIDSSGGHHHRLINTPNADPVASVSIYPNPVPVSATIHVSNTSGNAIFRMYDITGKLVMVKTVSNGDFLFNRDKMVAGLYFYRLDDGTTNLANGKLILQ